MPTTTNLVESRKKTFFSFQYPNSGKIRIKIVSNVAVDIFILPGNIDVNKINSVNDAISQGAISYPNRTLLPDQIVILNPNWRPFGWKLIIGNPTSINAAISYDIVEVT